MATIPYFRIRAPHVVHETLAGETVIVNLANGHYYSLRASGADLWRLVEAGASVAQMQADLAGRFAAEAGAVETAVTRLLAELDQAGLIQPVAARDDATYQPPLPTPDAARPSFTEPVLEHFTDAEELLLLDPVHDVGEAGWPHKTAEQPG